jgi:hypothetical protein
MRTVLSILALASVILLLGPGPLPITAQTATTPTPTTVLPTPSPTTAPAPSPAQILSRMRQAEVQENTMHLVSHMRMSNKVVTDEMAQIADLSYKPYLWSVAETLRENLHFTKPGKTTIYHDTVLAVGYQVAVRGSPFGREWTCARSQFVTSWGVISPIIHASVNHPTLLGTPKINGIDVWHIHAVLGPNASTQEIAIPVDYYISRADYTLVRELFAEPLVVSGPIPKGEHVTERKYTIDFSRYGEPFHLRLPLVCTNPAAFTVQTITIDRQNAQPDFSLKRPSLHWVHAGTRVKLSVYMYFFRVRRNVHGQLVVHVYRNGRLVFSSGQNDRLNPRYSHEQGWYADSFTPWHPGHFRVTAVYMCWGIRKQKTVWFTVGPPSSQRKTYRPAPHQRVFVQSR